MLIRCLCYFCEFKNFVAPEEPTTEDQTFSIGNLSIDDRRINVRKWKWRSSVLQHPRFISRHPSDYSSVLDPCAVSAYSIMLLQTRWSYYEWWDLQQDLSVYETCQSIIFESMCQNECQGTESSTRKFAELSWRHALASDFCAVSAVATISTSGWYYASVQGLSVLITSMH